MLSGSLLVAGGVWAAIGVGRETRVVPEGFKVFSVDGGRSAVAVGTPHEGVLDTWWRGHDGRFSRVRRVDVPGGGYWSGTEAAATGSTVVVHVFLRAPIDPRTGEPNGPDRAVLVACHAGVCDSRVVPAGARAPHAPQLTQDGRAAYFGRSPAGYLVWHQGRGLAAEAVRGLPLGTVATSEPLLAPNGALRVVVGVRTSGGCRMTLFTSGTNDAAFVGSVSVRRPRATSLPSCGSSLESVRSDSVTMSTVPTALPVVLALRDGSWSRVARDPSGLVHMVRAPHSLVGFSARVGSWHGREVSVASPDGRRVTVQLHVEGSGTWTPPQTVARVPQRPHCWDLAPTPSVGRDPFYVTVRCRERPLAGGDWVYSFLTAISDDGTTWQVVPGESLPLLVGDDVLLKGHPPYQWSAEAGLARVELPVPEDADYSLLEGGTSVLTRIVPGPRSCRLLVRTASRGAVSWSAHVTDTAGRVPSPAACELPHVQTEGTTAYFYYRHSAVHDALVRRADTWVVVRGR